jgi:hypothetical protein
MLAVFLIEIPESAADLFSDSNPGMEIDKLKAVDRRIADLQIYLIACFKQDVYETKISMKIIDLMESFGEDPALILDFESSWKDITYTNYGIRTAI